MIPWDYSKVDEYFYPPEEYRYSHVEINEYLGEKIVTHHLIDSDRIPYFIDTNYLYSHLNSD